MGDDLRGSGSVKNIFSGKPKFLFRRADSNLDT